MTQKLLDLILLLLLETVLNCETIDQYQPSHTQNTCASNCFHKYFSENKSIDPNQFGFQVGHSTDHAIIQLVDQIFEGFENNL